MKIKTRLLFIVSLVITFALTILIIRLITTAQVNQTAALSQKSDAIVREVFGLNNLLNDYLLYHTQRAKSQWILEQHHITTLLAIQQYINADDIAMQKKIESVNKSNSIIFSKLTDAYQNGATKDLQDRLTSQLLINSQSLVANSIILSARSSTEAETLRTTTRNLINVLLVILICSVVILMYLFYRSIIDPITKLYKGSLEVGAGNWNYKVDLKSKDELGQLASAFNNMTTQVSAYIKQQKQMEKQKDNFIASASHELKTPLTSIKVFAEIMQHRFQKSGDNESVTLFKKINIQLNKLSSLVNDLLDVNKIENNKLLYKTELFDMNTLIQDTIVEMQRTANSHVIMQHLDSSKEIFGDRMRIGQVLTNLISNAIKYSPNAEEVILSTKYSKDTFQVNVKDFGIGIAKRDQKKIFKRFSRVNGTVEQTYPGMGLGLYISKEIITHHKGKIWIKSQKGKGSTFSFSLPLS